MALTTDQKATKALNLKIQVEARLAQQIFDLFLPFFQEAEGVKSIGFFMYEDRFNEEDIIINSNTHISDYYDDKYTEFIHKIGEAREEIEKIKDKSFLEKTVSNEIVKALDEIQIKANSLQKDDKIVGICNKYFSDYEQDNLPTCPAAHKLFLKLIGRIKWPHDYQEHVRAIIHRDGTIVVDDNEKYDYAKVKAVSPFKEIKHEHASQQ